MWSLVRPPCSVEVAACGGVCAALRGSSVPFSATCMNALVISYRVIGSHFHPFVRLCECEREKRSRAISRPSSLFPWMAPAGGNCPSLSSYLAEVLFTPPHVKFINISPSFFFFSSFFLPLRMSSDQVFLPSCFLLRPKWPPQMYGAPKRAVAFTRTGLRRERRVVSWMRGNWVKFDGVKL